MGLCVTFVSGIRRSGKSAVIHSMIDLLAEVPPHYLRLVRTGSDKAPPGRKVNRAPKELGVASARWIEYRADRIFEILPEVLTAIHKADRFGSVVIEADADPILRHAYPYDHRVFVMPNPPNIAAVFRDPREAAREFRRALDDTAAFAEEIFGLFTDADQEDAEPHEDRPDLSGSHLRGFLYSPLGDELATRIQLQQAYHGLVESDIVIVNEAVGKPGPETERCVQRIGRLLERIRGVTGRKSELFICDPAEPSGPVGKSLLKALKPMCLGGH